MEHDPEAQGVDDSPRNLKRPLEEGQAADGDQQGPPFKRPAPGERAEAVMRMIVPARKVRCLPLNPVVWLEVLPTLLLTGCLCPPNAWDFPRQHAHTMQPLAVL